jgi:cation transport regulator ChaC
MKKLVLAGFAAALLGTAAMVPQAEARCWVNAYGSHCWHPHAWYHHHWRTYAYWHHHPYAWRY